MTAPVSNVDAQKANMTALAVSNRILIKVVGVKNLKTLFFIILNDTFHVVNYDRAILLRWGDTPKLLGVSGQYQESKRSDLTEKWVNAIQNVKAPETTQIFEQSSFKEEYKGWDDLQAETSPTILWIPLLQSGNNGIGLWLERWKGSSHGSEFSNEQIEFLNTILIPGYTEALRKLNYPFKKFAVGKFLKVHWLKILSGLLIASLLIRVPLRVVAPSEVVPKKPIIVTAPIEGIIKEVLVHPGQYVEEGTVLVEYDKRVFQQELKASQKEVQIALEEFNRALTLGVKDDKSISELSELELKLQKAKIHHQLIKVQVSKLTIKAPEKGVVIMQNPEEWRGKPVKVGEKIVTLGNPQETQIKAWIPENDNLPINLETPINVYLNVAPEKALQAKVSFISNESALSENQIPSFVAEADWLENDPNIRLGLKGTTVLYGENVSLLYYFLRKPISSFRRITGL